MVKSKSIDDLFPTLKRAAIELQRRVKEKGFDLAISSTYRDIEYQNSLYEQGRTKPGNIVTKAKGGQSYHNYRLAFDIIQNKKGSEYDIKFLTMVGKMAEEMGLEWGGSWKGFVDMPHIQWIDGLTLSQLQNGIKPVDKKLSWEVTKEKLEIKAEVFVDKKEDAEKPISVEEIIIKIDGKDYKVERILKNGENYIKLKSFLQAGYEVFYLEAEKKASINKPKQ